MARRRRSRDRRTRKSTHQVWVVGFLITAAGIWSYARYVSPVLESTPQRAASTADPKSNSGLATDQDSAANSTEEAGRNGAGRNGADRNGADRNEVDNRLLVRANTDAIPRLISRRPEASDGGAGRDVVEKGAMPAGKDQPAKGPKGIKDLERAKKLFAVGMEANARGDVIPAREHLTEAAELGLPRQELIEARAVLTKIGSETIFGSEVVEGDPYVSIYTVQSGDLLSKIAKQFSVTDDFLASINNIANKNKIRVGQNLKVVHGPFHARIDPATYSLDIYLDRTFVRHYRVGLGKNNSTPTGEWLTGEKLINPTFFPPPSLGGKTIAADDPENPLGERWIALVGVSGNAVGQMSYGIHGTIEPESIGRSESLGCVRMHNEDVAEVFTYLARKKSRVTVLPRE